MGRAPVTKQAITATLAGAGLAPRHRWGQNFLVDERKLDLIADLVQVTSGDVVLEPGPGLGGLTERLLERGASVLAAEIDAGFCRLLPGLLGHPAGLEVVQGDVMQRKSALSQAVLDRLGSMLSGSGRTTWKVASNLPYQISSPFLAGLVLLPEVSWTRAVLTLQKEVAAGVRAEAGSRAYSPLGFLGSLYLQVERGPRLPGNCFHPRPQVASEVVILAPKLAGRVPPRVLMPFVRRLFQGRRKAMRGTLVDAFRSAGRPVPRDTDAAGLLEEAGLSGSDRVDAVPARDIERLFRRGLALAAHCSPADDVGGG